MKNNFFYVISLIFILFASILSIEVMADNIIPNMNIFTHENSHRGNSNMTVKKLKDRNFVTFLKLILKN